MGFSQENRFGKKKTYLAWVRKGRMCRELPRSFFLGGVGGLYNRPLIFFSSVYLFSLKNIGKLTGKLHKPLFP